MKFLKTYRIKNDLSDFQRNGEDLDSEELNVAKEVILTQDDIFNQIGEFSGKYERKNFANYAKYLIFQDVYSIIGNMVFSGNNDNSNKIAKSFENNSKDIFKELTEKGKCYLKFDKFSFTIVDSSKDYDFFLVDDVYKNTSITRGNASRSIIDFISDLENSENAVINQAEAQNIFTPKEKIFNITEKTRLYDRFRNFFGIKKGQQKSAFMDFPLEHHALNYSDFGQMEKIKFQFQKLCKLFMYPEDLYFANTTFNNKDLAELKLCYNYAGYFYNLINQLLKNVVNFNFDISNFTIDFYGVKQWEEAKKVRIENEKNNIRFLIELKMQGFDVNEKITQQIENL